MESTSQSPLSERQFTAQVLAHARASGWLAAHFGNTVKIVRRGDKTIPVPDKDAVGFPDLVLARHERLVVVELKIGKNKPSAEQVQWLFALAVAGAESHLWTPDDWKEIEEVLR